MKFVLIFCFLVTFLENQFYSLFILLRISSLPTLYFLIQIVLSHHTETKQLLLKFFVACVFQDYDRNILCALHCKRLSLLSFD